MAISEEGKTELQKVDTKKIKPRKVKPEKPKKPAATEMTFFEHLGELRSRLIWSCLVIVISTAASWVFHKDLYRAFEDLFRGPAEEVARRGFPKPELIVTDVVNSFGIYFELALYAGMLLASPVIVYHVLAFMAPALEPETRPGETGHEDEVKMLKAIKRSLIFFIPLVAVFFLIGIAFAYYLVIPRAIQFLLGFSEGQFTSLIDAKKFIGQMSKIMFWSGLVFEMPIIMFLLAKLQIVNWKKLAGWWKWALVMSLVIAAFITPSPDLFSQAIIAIPVFGLYWLGVLFARFA